MIARALRSKVPNSPLLANCMNRYPYSLDQTSMASRSSLFYSQDNTYNADTIAYNFHLLLHPGQKYQGLAKIAFNLQKTG